MIDPSLSRLYFLAICGTAMGGVAALLKRRGYDVSGSDHGVYPPMSEFLRQEEITVYQGFSTSHLSTAPDIAVIGNSMSRGNVEVEAILNAQIPYMSLPEVIKEFFLRGKRPIVFTGTHGKTTMTALAVHIFQQSHLNPGYLVGGIPQSTGVGCDDGDGEYFCIEGDEYDSAFFDKRSKFLHYLPEIGVINNIEYDHADIFPAIHDVILAFKRFVLLIPSNGCLIFNADDVHAAAVAREALCKTVSYGFQNSADIQCVEYSEMEAGCAIRLNHQGENVQMLTPVRGKHNIYNIMAVFAVAQLCHIAPESFQQAVSSFPGIKRRLELLYDKHDVMVIEDFAHHPTAIRYALQTLRDAYPRKKIRCAFEPRSNTTRRHIFQNQFPESFATADEVCIGALYRRDRLKPDECLDVDRLISDMRGNGIDAKAFRNNRELLHYYQSSVHAGDLFLFMSNGGFDNIQHAFVRELLSLH